MRKASLIKALWRIFYFLTGLSVGITTVMLVSEKVDTRITVVIGILAAVIIACFFFILIFLEKETERLELIKFKRSYSANNKTGDEQL